MTGKITLRVLIWKNILLFTRKSSTGLFLIFVPLVVAWFLNLLCNVADEVQNIGKIEVELQDIPKMAHCGERGDYDPRIHEPCLTLGYSFIG